MKRNQKGTPEISAGSMADVAFLLLIFFLVATTIDTDKGIVVKLPPWCEGADCITKEGSRVFSVAVNLHDQLLVEGEQLEVRQLRNTAKKFIRDRNKDAVISLINDRGTSYDTYIAVYNELKGAYNEIWEEEAQSRYGQTYEKLEQVKKKQIRVDWPLVISEAEPTDFAMAY